MQNAAPLPRITWDNFSIWRNGGFGMGDTLVVQGGRGLYGAVDTPTAKNSVLPLLAASLLCHEPVRLHRVPRLSDVEDCLAILRGVGAQTQWVGRTVVVQAGEIVSTVLPTAPVERMRASVLFLAPMLARTGRVTAALPGGCRLGPRPIDIHLAGLAAMGAQVQNESCRMTLTAPGGLRGTDFTLRLPSVGATETMLLAAACAKGQTVLRGAACEPEIVDLANFLNACGARITGAGSPVIHITGVPQLGGAGYRPIPDRIAAATLACAVAAAGGHAVIRRCEPSAFAPVLEALQRAGCSVAVDADCQLTVERLGPLHGADLVQTGAHPAFPTDAAPLLAAALLWADGETTVRDTVFRQRFACAEGFAAMGAKVCVQGEQLTVCPGGRGRGAAVFAPDLRGGAALAIAALAVHEPVYIHNAAVLRRGYEDLPALLRRLGAQAQLR